jgi:hypothetical protein
MNSGFVKIFRKFEEWEWYRKSEMVHLFLHFLLLANHKQGKWQGKTIERGQFITGLLSLEEQTGISYQTLRTCISRLKATGEIHVKSTNKFSLITIVNYKDYQDKENNQQTTNKQLTTNKNDKKNKNRIHASGDATIIQVIETKQTTMKKNSFKYNESESNSFEDEIDYSSGEKIEEPKSNQNDVMWELIKWAEDRKKSKFLNYPKQLKAISKMKSALITPSEIMNRWDDLEKVEYYKINGFDFASILNSFDKKR